MSLDSWPSEGGGDCALEDFFIALGIAMTLIYILSLGLLGLTRSIPGTNEENSQYLVCLVLWWLPQVNSR